jgi:TldD protein
VLTRRSFLVGSSAAAAATALTAPGRIRLAAARGLLTDRTLDDIVQRGLAAAKKAGATYADVRIVRKQEESVEVRDDHIDGVSSTESYGLAVRVIAGGAWGFAASAAVTGKEVERVARLSVDIAKANAAVIARPVALAKTEAHVDVWQTPLTRDPFKIPLEDKAELLLAIAAEALKVKGARYCRASYQGQKEWKLLATSEGAYIEQEIVRVFPGYGVTAVDDKAGEFETRRHDVQPMQGGWELVESAPLVADARRIAEEAVQKVKAPTVASGSWDIVVAPSQLWLTIHESIGHPTELDRALGYEANFAGTSFATTDKLNKLRMAAPIVSLYADRTTPGGLATCGYDDDGVATQRWDIVKDGRFVGYQTTREQAGWIGETASRGCSYGQDFRSIPFQRMPNISLAPAARPVRQSDLIAGVDRGLLFIGRDTYSIDHQRYNFQFGGNAAYEIAKGKIKGMVRNVVYQSNTIDFWNRCDALGGAGSWALGGSFHDGKGEPGQLNAVSHGCPPARFRGINIVSTRKA